MAAFARNIFRKLLDEYSADKVLGALSSACEHLATNPTATASLAAAATVTAAAGAYIPSGDPTITNCLFLKNRSGTTDRGRICHSLN